MADADDTRPDDADPAGANAPDERSADAASSPELPAGAPPADATDGAPAADAAAADSETRAAAERRLVDLFQATVYSQDDERIGRVGQVYLDDQTQEPNWVTVKSGFFGSKQFFVPLDEADVDGRQIVVPYTKDLVTGAPVTVVDQNLSPEEEDALYAHYNVPGRVPGVETSEDAAASRAAAAERDPDIPVFDPRTEAERDSLAADLAGGSADASGGAGAGAFSDAPTAAFSPFAKPEPAAEEQAPAPEEPAAQPEPSDATAQWTRPEPETPATAPVPTSEPAVEPAASAPAPESEPAPAPEQPAEPEPTPAEPTPAEPEPEPARDEPRDEPPASEEAPEPPSPLDAFKGLRFGAPADDARDDRPGGLAELSDLFGPPTTETPVVPQGGAPDADAQADRDDETDGPSDDASFRRPEEH